MKLVELKELAKRMGLRGISMMRKPELIATLQAARSGGKAPAGVTVATPRVARRSQASAAADAEDENQGSACANGPAAAAFADKPAFVESAAPRAKGLRRPQTEGIEKFDLGITLPTRQDSKRRRDGMDFNEEQSRGLDSILAVLPDHSGRHSDDGLRDRQREDHAERGFRRQHDRAGRRSDRDSREEARESRPEREDRPLVPVAGIVDILDSYAFIRTSGYLPGPNDVYVSMGMVKKYGLRKGDAVQGVIRPPRENDRRSQRQKFVPLQAITSINGMDMEEARERPQFSKLTPLYPQERLRMETEPSKFVGRLIDIVSPIGKGQRGLIVAPPKAGKTITLQNIANAITANNPECHLMVVLVDERPEEVTDMQRTVHGEVISSTFDRPASDHTIVAELAIERAKRLVELGQDVVVLLDSITRLARAYNIAAPASGKVLSGGVDAQALYPPKKFFGAARNVENGGSLTIIATALVETGSKMDEVIFEEFKGTGNMELKLSRDLADKRLFPAIDISASGTRREELITPKAQLAIIYRLRRLLGGMDAEQAYQTLVPRVKKTPTNKDFFTVIAQNMNLPKTA